MDAADIFTEEAWNARQDKMVNQLGLMLDALSRIAYGRTDCGRPLGGNVARDLARECLTKCELSWSRPRQPGELDWEEVLRQNNLACGFTRFIPEE